MSDSTDLVAVGNSLKPLRPYQARAIADAKAAFRSGKRAILLVCPTGGGKTRLATEIVTGALRKGGAVLWLAHREELLTQAAQSIMAEGVRHVGIIAPWARRQQASVQVASVQTLAAQLRKGRDMPPASVVVFDEAHHFAPGAAGWFEVADKLRGATMIGLTATPERGDGSPLGDLFDTLIPVSSVGELQQTIDERTGRAVLVPCVTYRPETETKALAREPIQAYQEHGAGERAFVFCASVLHAESVAQTFRDAGVPAATIHADTPWALRKARVEAFRSQDPTPLRRAGSPEDPPLALCNVYTLTEGVDVPEASVCILARGCGHAGMMLQMAGRVLRNAPSKERAILWDLRGATHKLQLPEADREYSLEGKAISARDDRDDPPKKCPMCGAQFVNWSVRADGTRYCPACGNSAPPVLPPDVEEREVFAAGSGATTRDQRDALDRFAIDALDRREPRKPGWVWHRFRDAYQVELDWKEIDGAMARARKLLGIRPTAGEIAAERAKLERIAADRGISMTWVTRKLAEKYGREAVAA